MAKFNFGSSIIAPILKGFSNLFDKDDEEEEEKKRKEEEKRKANSKKINPPSENIAPVKKTYTIADSSPLAPITKNATPESTTQKKKTEKVAPVATFSPISPMFEMDYRPETVPGMNGAIKKNLEGEWYDRILKSPEVLTEALTLSDISAKDTGNILKSSANDLALNIISGAGNFVEGITDAVGYGVSDALGAFGADNFASKLHDKAKENTVQNLLSDEFEKNDKNSIFGDYADSAAQGLGQIGVNVLGGSVLKGLGLGTKALSAASSIGIGMSGAGSGMSEAYQNDATDKEAKIYGMITGAAESLSELMFGGLGKVAKAAGIGKGLLSIDDMFAKKVSGIFENQIAKNLTEYAIKSGAESIEEAVAGFASAIGQKMTYRSEDDFRAILRDQNIIEQMITSFATSAIAQAGDLHTANKNKTDFISGLTSEQQKEIDKAIAEEKKKNTLTETERKVVDKETENRIKELEDSGEKVKRSKVHKEVMKDLEEGLISIDTIESALGGETYKKYKEAIDNEDAVKNEFDVLNKMKQGDMTGEQSDRRNELKKQLEEMNNSTVTSDLKKQLGDEVFNISKNTRLEESYREVERGKQAFNADLSKYDEKQQTIVKAAIESGVLNNTNKSHRFVDFVAKISADKGITFDFTNNKKLQDSVFAVEGRDVSGYVVGGNVTVNVSSKRMLNSIVGHEIMHVLKGTDLYAPLTEALTAYSKSIGEYNSRLENTTSLYEGMNADINEELFADMVGDYIFADEDFVRRLSTENRNVFQKVYDEIKYLCKTATTASDEGRQLLKAKHIFEKMYRENISSESAEGDVKYSFAGPKSKATDFSSLELAIRLEDVGKATSEEIRQQTGWVRGYDNMWRYEIDDSKMKILDVDITSGETKLSEVLEHPELFEAYPQLKDVTVSAFPSIFYFDKGGSYNPTKKEISLSSDYLVNTKVDKEIAKIKESPEYISYKQRIDEAAKAHGEKRLALAKEFKAIKETPAYTEYVDNYFECSTVEEAEAVISKWESSEEGKRYNAIKEELARLDRENPQTIIEKEFNESETGKRYNELLSNIDFSEITNDEKTRSTLIHEIQHAIQDIEGFANGSSPEFWKKAPVEKKPGTLGYAKAQRDKVGQEILSSASPEFIEAFRAYNRGDIEYSDIENGNYSDEELELLWDYDEADREVSYIQNHKSRSDEDLYLSTAGEIEARNVSARLDYDEAKRKRTRPDIDRSDVVFAEDNISSSSKEYIEKTNEILYNKNSPLSVENRAKTNNNSSLKWVYDAKIFSVEESILFHDEISRINQNRDVLGYTKNTAGEYMIPVRNKIVFTDGDYEHPYVREVVEVLTEYSTEFEKIRERIYNVEKGKSEKQKTLRTLNQVFGDGIILSYRGGVDGVYDWQNGRRKGRTRKEVIRNYLNKQFGKGNGRASKEAQVNEIAPIKETSSEGDVFFDAQNSNTDYSLSAPVRTETKRRARDIYGDDISLDASENIAPIRENVKKADSAEPVKAAVAEKKKIAPIREDLKASDKEKKFTTLDIVEDDAEVKTEVKSEEAKVKSEEASSVSVSLSDTSLDNIAKTVRKALSLTPAEKKTVKEIVSRYAESGVRDTERLYEELRDNFAERSYKERVEEIADVKHALKSFKIFVPQNIKNGITDYSDFRRRNFGKLTISNEGTSVDKVYEALSYSFPNFFPPDIANDTDRLMQMEEVGNLEIYKDGTDMLSDESIREVAEVVDDVVNTAKEKQAAKEAERLEKEKNKPMKRSELHGKIIDGFKAVFRDKGFDMDKVLLNAKNISTIRINDTKPNRVMKKTLGFAEGDVLADLTVNKVAQNESEGIKWLNSFLDRKSGLLAKISEQYGIEPGSKESAAAQMYAEGFYVNKKNEVIAYGDRELIKDFKDPKVRQNIVDLANDKRIRQIYDETLEAINKSRKRNGYDEIPRLDNYFLHFRAMGDTFSKIGIPFNKDVINADNLPTNLNGVTLDLKPGQPYFASAKHREGIRTDFDLLGGLEKYLTSAKNQIYHIDDIQNLRALRNYIAEMFGEAQGMRNLDSLSENEVQSAIKEHYNKHLSNFAKFLNEEANILAGKKSLIDRGVEGNFGRWIFPFLDALNKQYSNNVIGGNISSALTNFITVPRAFAKINKTDFVKGFSQFVSNKIKVHKGLESDGFAENSPVLIRRKGAESFYRKPYEKITDKSYRLMGLTDDISSEIIARAKYNELIRKGMDSQKAHFETDKWVSDHMGDRSYGQMPLVYNSKILGLFTKFQLEVRNDLDSDFYDVIQEAKLSTKNIENKLERNAKKATKVISTMLQLAVGVHVFGQFFEKGVGYNPAFDIIEVIATAFGLDDDEDEKEPVLDNISQALYELISDLPYSSILTGGRIPLSSMLPYGSISAAAEGIKEDYENGNFKNIGLEFIDSALGFALPTGYNQIKKTVQGLQMFSDKHPIKGSYTDSGNLRFPIDDTAGNRVQAALFGQYASKNAREYFDEGFAPLRDKQIEEFKETGMSYGDYQKYRKGLSGLKTLNEKGDYIGGLDVPVSTKNILINNIADRDEPIDMTDYGKYKDFQEFDLASRYDEKYKVLKEQGVSVKDYKENHEKTVMIFTDDYSWAADNPEQYAISKAVTDDVTVFRKYKKDISALEADKDKYGNSINGSKKKKQKDYIFSLPIEYGQKIILYRSMFDSKADKRAYNNDIIDYLISREDLSEEDKIAILEKLDFTVDEEGYVTW